MVAGIWSIDMEYLEDEGIITWIQLFAIGDTTTVVYGLLFWFIFMSLKYHKYNKYNDTYLSFILSILPRCDHETWISTCQLNKSWTRLVARGFTLGFDGQFYMAALLYCDSGDAMMLRMTLNSFLGAVVSILFFKEAFTLWMVLAFVLGIVGLILICQPSFIFDTSTSDSISWFAILLVLLSSSSRTIDKTVVKMSHANDSKYNSNSNELETIDTDGDEGVHWLPMVVIPYFITSLIAWTELALFAMYKYYVNESTTLWYDFNITSVNSIAVSGICLFGAIDITTPDRLAASFSGDINRYIFAAEAAYFPNYSHTWWCNKNSNN